MAHQFTDNTLTWLYKFRPLTAECISYTLRTITHHELYLSNPANFNDPFECRPGYYLNGSEEEIKCFVNSLMRRNSPFVPEAEIKPMVDEALKLFSTPEERERTAIVMNETIGREINKFGICCFPEDWKSILMWSHYADSHRGVCFRFRADAYTPLFGEAQRVFYTDTFPVVNPIIADHREDVIKILLTKSHQWSYEREWRVLDKKSGAGVRKFHPSALKSILMGAKISPEHEDIIMDIARKHPSRPAVKKLQINPFKYELRISSS